MNAFLVWGIILGYGVIALGFIYVSIAYFDEHVDTAILNGIFWPIVPVIRFLINHACDVATKRRMKLLTLQDVYFSDSKDCNYRFHWFRVSSNEVLTLDAAEFRAALEWADNQKQFKKDFKDMIK